MTFFERIRELELNKNQLMLELRRTNFMRNLEKIANSKSYDIFFEEELLGKELRSTRAHGPIYLKDIIIPSCYFGDKKTIKKKMIRLILDINFWGDGEHDYEDNNEKTACNVWLDIPSSLLESWSLRKMKKWAKELSQKTRSNILKSLNEDLKELQEKINKFSEII